MSDDATSTPDTLPPSSLEALLTAFQQIAEAASARTREEISGERLIARLTEHLGTDPRDLPVVTEMIPLLRVADADVALEHLGATYATGEPIGVSGGEQRWHVSLSEMLQNDRWTPLTVAPVDYRTEATGPEEERNVVSFGLHLFTVGGTPLVVLQRGSNPQYGAEPKLELLCADAATTRSLLEEIREVMSTRSVLRGKVVSFSSSPFEQGAGGITFLPRPRVPEDSIVLPDGLLTRVRRHVIGIGERAEELGRLGQHLKRGVLLYGPPGTGKTLTVRHLVGESDATVIMLTGPALAAIGLAARTARALAPALVVLEDCDLVAEERSQFSSSPLLFEVLDSLDGMASDSDVAFLLTTNRVDVLEPALAQRPGRIDLAVEVPLPDGSARLALFEVYTRGLRLGRACLAEAAGATAGTTASFARESVRRAVLEATEAGRDVTDDDLLGAVREMMADARSISRSMLGSFDVTDGVDHDDDDTAATDG